MKNDGKSKGKAGGWSAGNGRGKGRKGERVEPCGQLASILTLANLEERREAVRVMNLRYGGELQKYLRSFGLCSQTAEDLHRDLLVKLERGYVRKKLKPGEKPRGTVFTAARNLARSWFRKKENTIGELNERMETQDCRTAPDSAHVVANGERDQKVREAVRSLPESERLAIEMIFFGTGTWEKVAEMIDRSIGAVRLALDRGMAKLSYRLNPDLLG